MSDDPILAFSTCNNPVMEKSDGSKLTLETSGRERVCLRFVLSSRNRCWVDMVGQL